MIKRIAQAWGFATILLLPSYVDLTSSLGDERTHVPGPLTKIALAQLTDLAIVALAFAGLMAILRRFESWTKVRWIFLACLPLCLFLRNLSLLPSHPSSALVLSGCAAWVVVLSFLLFRTPSIASRLYRLGGVVLTGSAVFAALISWQLVRAALWQPAPQAFSHPIPASPSDKPRLVWIIFDELAYKQIFETRDPSLQLPNFDRLRSESTLYTRVTPIGNKTILVIPGLLSGSIVTSATYTTDNRYLIQTADSSNTQPFDVNASVFGMANRSGLTTSIIGWYITYCPIFATAAQECYWTNDDTELGAPPSRDAGFAENVWFPLRVLLEQTFEPPRARKDIATWNSEGHIASVKDVGSHALATLSTSQADLIYIHLPTPHPPAFWNRRSGSFGAGGSYLDSLDYSDRLLGQILDLLQSQPRWAATTLIVQGDHSWRTHLWRGMPGWSSEDERISNAGQWDPRPALLIHAAGQQDPATVSTPTSLMFVHDFVAGQIQAAATRPQPVQSPQGHSALSR